MAHVPYFDGHSVPVSKIFNEKIQKIDWIPIDVEGIDHVKMTRYLLSKYGIEMDFSILDELATTLRYYQMPVLQIPNPISQSQPFLDKC